MAVPTVWTTYQVPDDVFSVIGSAVGVPPSVVLEMMALNGSAKRVGTVTTHGVEVLEENDDDEEKRGPWLDK